MRSMHRRLLLGGALVALVFATTSVSHAATILKLNLGGVSPDVSMSMVGGSLSTVDDLNPGTLGDQDTAIEYTGFLDCAVRGH